MLRLAEKSTGANPVSDWRRFNRRLDRQNPLLVNEPWLEGKILELETIGRWGDDAYWLTLARLNELALFCAGQYADAGELGAVGDLLVNPRAILVHIKNDPLVARKERHTPLTEQFKVRADGGDVKRWLKDNTMLEMKEKAILPALLDALRSGGRIAGAYLLSVQERHQRIADTMSLVSASHFPRHVDFKLCLARMAGADRACVEARLCRFDLTVFMDIGREIVRILSCPDFPAGYPLGGTSPNSSGQDSRPPTPESRPIPLEAAR